jgi:hypothetical protein
MRASCHSPWEQPRARPHRVSPCSSWPLRLLVPLLAATCGLLGAPAVAAASAPVVQTLQA